MLMQFIAAFAAAIMGAGVAMILRHLTGGAIPRAAIPVMAGLGMLIMTIWNEYSWFTRTKASLPEGVEVIQTQEHTFWYRPWTFVYPFIDQFMAVDRATVRTNPNVPGHLIAEILIFGQHQGISKIPLLIDCPNKRRADIMDGAEFGADGAVTNAEWREIEPGDPLLGAICA